MRTTRHRADRRRARRRVGHPIRCGLVASQRSVDYMEAVAVGDGVIGARPTLIRSLSSLFTIASGGSIGREGPWCSYLR